MTGPSAVSVLAEPTLAVGTLVGLAVLSGGLAAVVALCYRWYVRQRIQTALPTLVGLSGVAAILNTTTALGQVIGGSTSPLAPDVALFNIAAFAIATGAASVGVHVGDALGVELFAATGGRNVDGEVSRLVETVGRVIAVELPDEIDDIVGYDPVSAETKAQLGGRTFLFPRRLTVADLEARLETRLQEDFGVGHVDVELAADGSVNYLAVGSRVAGIGPTLPPETTAIAIRADPALATSAGDVVQVWRTDPMERVTTAEVRGVADDVVTLAVDASDRTALDADTTYNLVTLPVETRPDREFASVLRAAAETMGVVEIEAGSALVGQPLGALDVTVVALRTAEDDLESIPPRTRTLTAGDGIYVIARPDVLRKLEASAAESVADTRSTVAEPSDADDD